MKNKVINIYNSLNLFNWKKKKI